MVSQRSSQAVVLGAGFHTKEMLSGRVEALQAKLSGRGQVTPTGRVKVRVRPEIGLLALLMLIGCTTKEGEMVDPVPETPKVRLEANSWMKT